MRVLQQGDLASVAPPTHDGVQKVSRSEQTSARGESSFGNARMLIHKSEKSSNKLTLRISERERERERGGGILDLHANESATAQTSIERRAH